MKDWTAYAKGVLRAEMLRRGMSYADLARALNDIGVPETEMNVRNKVGRGTFSAPFLFQCLNAMRVTTLHLD
ncbi:DUF6471 domain-containing protein [Sphingorhabdus sp.]|uniref:DUF6471 domain-containing protein n=1 Tax=Sphingorhabdus sp. TaxID=1902408 RepID=UPI0039188F6B